MEAFLPGEVSGFVPAEALWRIAAGFAFGLTIGLVSSMLGVAGGELIIPTLVFAFGADIKTAGTASLLVSVPTVIVGLIRYTSCVCQPGMGSVSLSVQASGGMEEPLSQQVKLGAAKHLALQGLESIDLALSLAIAPHRRDGRLDGRLIAP